MALVEARRPAVVLIDDSAGPNIEYTALQSLDLEAALSESGSSPWLRRVRPRAVQGDAAGAARGNE